MRVSGGGPEGGDALADAGLGETLTDGLADGIADDVPAACWMAVCCGPPEKASMTPSVRPSAIGIASGTAQRAARLCCRRQADRRPIGMNPPPCELQSSRWITVDPRFSRYVASQYHRGHHLRAPAGLAGPGPRAPTRPCGVVHA